MIRYFLLLLVVTALPLIALAQPTEVFAVQIGTYKHFAEETKKSALQFGEVHILTYEDLSRVTVGEFTNRQEATALLQKLKEAGFKDAFVRQIGYIDLDKVQSNIEKFNVLLSEMDAQVFYLDGYKYIFMGNGYLEMRQQDEPVK